jgi:hypothetical protein
MQVMVSQSIDMMYVGVGIVNLLLRCGIATRKYDVIAGGCTAFFFMGQYAKYQVMLDVL